MSDVLPEGYYILGDDRYHCFKHGNATRLWQVVPGSEGTLGILKDGSHQGVEFFVADDGRLFFVKRDSTVGLGSPDSDSGYTVDDLQPYLRLA